ncbi:30S ribosomal protein S6 [Gammaproteobacteria bacterium]|jgi:small subunit ribosomal protein S6|nr:30S ribosomal protein S6 [Gammaproteobacteria bacterium]
MTIRHYEAVHLIHPNHSAEVPDIIKGHEQAVKEFGGKLYRIEDWGRHHLKYEIKHVKKAHFVLVNMGGDQDFFDKYTKHFKKNDLFIRSLLIRTKQPETGKSIGLKQEEKTVKRKGPQNRRSQRVDGVDKFVADYKNFEGIKVFLLESGKIIPGRLTGATIKMQRKITLAVKRARFIGLLPYCNRHK